MESGREGKQHSAPGRRLVTAYSSASASLSLQLAADLGLGRGACCLAGIATASSPSHLPTCCCIWPQAPVLCQPGQVAADQSLASLPRGGRWKPAYLPLALCSVTGGSNTVQSVARLEMCRTGSTPPTCTKISTGGRTSTRWKGREVLAWAADRKGARRYWCHQTGGCLAPFGRKFCGGQHAPRAHGAV